MTLKLSKLLTREEPLSEKEHVFILGRISGLIDEVRRRKLPDLLINAYMLGIQDAALAAQAVASPAAAVGRSMGFCALCARPNRDPRPWDDRSALCPDCEDRDPPAPSP